MTPVNLSLLDEIMSHMMTRGVPYKLGAKAPSLTCDSSEIDEIDCSGLSRYLIARCTNQQVILPDGSQAQKDWAKENLKAASYSVGVPGGLYICFISPKEGDWPRHVWLRRQGFTRESCGSQGVTERPWNTPVLLNSVSGCYLLPFARGQP